MAPVARIAVKTHFPLSTTDFVCLNSKTNKLRHLQADSFISTKNYLFKSLNKYG